MVLWNDAQILKSHNTRLFVDALIFCSLNEFLPRSRPTLNVALKSDHGHSSSPPNPMEIGNFHNRIAPNSISDDSS